MTHPNVLSNIYIVPFSLQGEGAQRIDPHLFGRKVLRKYLSEQLY